MSSLQHLAWPPRRLAEAIEVVARRGGLSPDSVETPAVPANLQELDEIGRWIEATSAGYGLEAEPVHIPYPDLELMLRSCAPAILALLMPSGPPLLLAVTASSRRNLQVVIPDGSVQQAPVETVARAICRLIEEPLANEIDALLEDAEVEDRHRQRARAALLRQRLAGLKLGGFWLVRLPAGAGFFSQLLLARIPHRFLGMVAAHLVQYLLWILAWWVVGRAALQGRLDPGWLLAWALLLLAVVPFRLLATWSQGVFAIAAGAVLKRRLLQGALRLRPEEVRHQGAGQLLGRVIESEAVESLALGGGFLAVLAVIELAVTGWVLAVGAAGLAHPLLLLAVAAISVFLGWRYYLRRRSWTGRRLDMTNDLVESMVGQRTRLAQGQPGRWHHGEDEVLEKYLECSRAMDHSAVVLAAGLPRAWLVLGIAAMVPAFVSGDASTGGLAVGLGGTLLGYQALNRLLTGLLQLSGAAIAWEQVSLLFTAAADREGTGSPQAALTLAAKPPLKGETIVDAQQLVFRYLEKGEPVLRGCDLRVGEGDRILIEGSSGGGKSTLASLLVGLRQPESGLLLLRGLDIKTLGADCWGKRVVAAPQFHENHVLTETFAFNLLMGRSWPASPADLREAEALCRELGLGELLQRMPSGLNQMVGETGWQLSHGERSRLYIARALLQNADMVVLDESFAALDPENLHRALRCVLKRTRTLVVIAHP